MKRQEEEEKSKHLEEVKHDNEVMREEMLHLMQTVERFQEDDDKNQKNAKILERLFEDGIIDHDGNMKH